MASRKSLLDLPPDIRLQIYKEYYGSLKIRLHATIWSPLLREHCEPVRRDARRCINILLTCKTFNAEAKLAFFSEPTYQVSGCACWMHLALEEGSYILGNFHGDHHQVNILTTKLKQWLASSTLNLSRTPTQSSLPECAQCSRYQYRCDGWNPLGPRCRGCDNGRHIRSCTHESIDKWTVREFHRIAADTLLQRVLRKQLGVGAEVAENQMQKNPLNFKLESVP